MFSYQFNSTTAVAYFSVFARGSGGWQNSYRPRSGYGLEMRPQSGTIDVIENNNGTTSTLASRASISASSKRSSSVAANDRKDRMTVRNKGCQAIKDGSCHLTVSLYIL